jgi:hypothetical protein
MGNITKEEVVIFSMLYEKFKSECMRISEILRKKFILTDLYNAYKDLDSFELDLPIGVVFSGSAINGTYGAAFPLQLILAEESLIERYAEKYVEAFNFCSKKINEKKEMSFLLPNDWQEDLIKRYEKYCSEIKEIVAENTALGNMVVNFEPSWLLPNV